MRYRGHGGTCWAHRAVLPTRGHRAACAFATPPRVCSAPQVANHVVQALLNQKVGVRQSLGVGDARGLGKVLAGTPPVPSCPEQDLREECIKLKKRVFDLERQNQALSDLFQQKLQLSAGSLPQVCPGLPGGEGGIKRQSPSKSLTQHLSPPHPAAAAPGASAPGCSSLPPAQLS